ncbi:MAG: autoinducer binding domain-containing protein [Pseudomonadota bacterium]
MTDPLDPVSATDKVEALDRIIRATSVEAAWDAFGEAAAACGFVTLLYGMARHPGPPDPIDPAEVLILHRGSPGWLDAYVDEQLYIDNPLFEWVQHNEGFDSVARIAAAFDGPLSPQMARLIALRAEHGIGPGYVGGLRDTMPGVNAGLTVNLPGGTEPEQAEAAWALHGAHMETLSRALHLRVATLPQPLLRPLSSRQREVLEWYSQGKAVRDIAVIIGVDASTVEKHLRLAREALNATNTSHAVRKALTLNLLRA